MKKLLLIGLAILATYMAGRALKKNNEVLTLLWALLGSTALATGTPANTAKARSTEDRLISVIGAVGTVNTAASNAQTTANNAYPKTGGTISGSATVTGSHTVNGNLNANSQVLVNGASGGNAVEINGTAHANGNIQADGTLLAGNQLLVNGASGGLQVEINGSGHINGSWQVDGNSSIAQMNGQNLPMGTLSTPAANFTSVIAFCNGVITRLQDVGLIS